MSKPLSQSDILFPHLSNTPNFSTTLSSLKRSTLSTHNRLSSIFSDSTFVTAVASAYALPLVANERCGSWYIPPSQKSESVYFKSTDGHMGQWGFSLRRLNLQVLDVVERAGGCVIVDSTRRGKSMPDALSKSVPIWCCVVNRVVFGEGEALYTPPLAVSESEKAQIEGRIGGFVREFLDVCKPNIADLRAKLKKPLRPIWVTHSSTLPESAPAFADFHPVVLCTASRRVHGAEGSEGGYIQGAADDHEAWSHGLTPPLFWANRELLMNTNEEDVPRLIADLVKQDRGADAIPTLIKPTSTLYISSSQNVDTSPFDVVVSCTPDPLPHIDAKAKVKYLHLNCQTGKLGSRDLRAQLPHIRPFFAALPPHPTKLLVCCPTGKDLAVGTALAILCLYADAHGTLNSERKTESREISKPVIKQKLSWITTSNPALNPSRATLQSVNAVLLGNWDPKAATTTTTTTTTTTHDPPQARTTTHVDKPTRIFHNLATHWTFTRTLTSALPSHPSGTVSGTARLTPCPSPSLSPSTSSDHTNTDTNTNTNTLLYTETGTFTTTTNLHFTTTRQYIYTLHPPTAPTPAAGEADTGPYIAVHFSPSPLSPSSSENAGLFVAIGPLTPGGEGVQEARNQAQHLCGGDVYTASWRFSAAMVGDGKGEREGEMWWEVRYDVNGPGKEYVSWTRYVRGVGE
ncbi:hypothetical protein P153DRAFT_342554 [Dothidotthia symphoricarpi CBS 119687]|uniref:tRNA A64-2'-O-ribosylphosphate transferase n=1 Tax=Dothidotthia symphoricarpi CBS 119687 TaxID=1392245 RepID=A0A6A6ACI5_9PLEO|nr:uncharacterized protein P153DRAFT_342554 [Dothidotthia symphoricarpi CBS 119687]KAF2128628.1 hypothetical protein P153DRAFT_342554 [Dothidotthia symphoricarpi CBS 119687]